MAATLSGPYPSAPDTPSPVYPDRLIRPLPKRRLRSRLSPDAADSILYPPAPPATQLFYGSYAANGDVNDSKVYVQQSDYVFEHGSERDHHYDDGIDSGDDEEAEIIRRSTLFQRSSLSPHPSDSRQKYAKHLENTPSKASSSGPDGYDAFENTNNKKKRKIPTSGNLGSHSSLSAEIASMGLSSGGSGNSVSLDDGSGTGSYYGTGHPASPAGNGISGSGRGRFGRNATRSGSGRLPLSAHTANSTWLGGRPGLSRREVAALGQEPTDEVTGSSEQGIISTAIANAATMSSTTPPGQENVSLLEQTKKPSPVKTQFTFTCESDSSKGMAWQTQTPYPIPQAHRSGNQGLSAAAAAASGRGFSTQGTQTSPNMVPPGNAHAAQANSQHASQGNQNPVAGKKTRRSAGSIYALAARQRRLQQQYTNLHHPPSLEDMWICEFCEYESIFGEPPAALIRQYEIKDRKERRRLAEKRRLLEKAKMKGRKGKKATKKAAAAAQNLPPAHHHSQQQHHGYDRQPPDHHTASGGGGHGHGALGDDYLEDEYEGDVQVPAHPHKHPHPHSHQPPPASNPNHVRANAAGQGKDASGSGGGRAG